MSDRAVAHDLNEMPNSTRQAARAIVVHEHRTPDIFWGRTRIRNRILAMQPSEPDTVRLPAVERGDKIWTLITSDDRTLAISAVNFTSSLDARAHAREVLSRADELVVVTARDARAGLRSAWFALDGIVVLAAGRGYGVLVQREEAFVLRALRGVNPAASIEELHPRRLALRTPRELRPALGTGEEAIP